MITKFIKWIRDMFTTKQEKDIDRQKWIDHIEASTGIDSSLDGLGEDLKVYDEEQ